MLEQFGPQQVGMPHVRFLQDKRWEMRMTGRAGMTQAELAQRMSTTQSTIARLESGRMMPSMRTFARYAQATNSHTVVRLVANT